MTVLQLRNDDVQIIPILVLDAAGDVVQAPPGDAFTVVSSDPSKLNAVVGQSSSGAQAVRINALVRLATGLSFTVNDSAGLKAFAEEVDIVEDTTPAAIGLDLAATEHEAQAVPTA